MRKSKLVDLRVERVDGVDKPASFQRWAIVKSEKDTSDVSGLAKTLIESLVKSETDLTDEQVDQVKALADACGLTLKAADPARPEPSADEPVTKSDLKTLLKEALDEMLADEIAELDEDEPVAKSATSRQPDEQDDVAKAAAPVRKKKGEGLFGNVVFGRATNRTNS